MRPYLGRYLWVVVCTLLAAGAEGGQIYLLKPLMDQVLLKGSDSEEDDADRAFAEAANREHGASIKTFPLPPPPQGELKLALKPFGGRLAPPEQKDDPVCQLLDRSRRVLVGTEAALEADDEAAWAELREAARYQLAAQALLGDDPLNSTPQDRSVAGWHSFRARELARQASFQGVLDTLQGVVLLALLAAVVLATARYFQTVIGRTLTVLIVRDMQIHVVGHVLTLAAGQLGERTRGDMLARVTSDLNRAGTDVLNPLSVTLLMQPLRLMMYLALAVFVSWQLSLILFLLAATVLWPILYAGKRIRRSSKVRQSAIAEVFEAMHQMFSGIRLVRVFQREAHEEERFREKTQRAYRAELKVIGARTASRNWLKLINDTTMPLVVLVGGYLVVNHYFGLKTGTLVAFAGLVLLMYRPTKALAQAYNSMQNGLPALHRVQEVFAQEPAVTDAEDAVELQGVSQEIRVEDVSFSYDGKKTVLHDVSFTAPAGTTTAFVGHTGSGKSTLMDLLLRYMDPTSGRILVDGAPLTGVKLASYLERVAVVSQETFLFNDTVRENIRYGRLDATDDEVEAAAKAARVHDEIMGLEGGYDYVAGEMGSRLSGGQIQRVSIARAMVRKPQLLFLDEAMSALDAQTEQLVQEAIARLGQGCTTFAIAHRLSTVRDADLILVLHEGRIVERGTHDELIAKGGRYAELARSMEPDPGDAPGADAA